MNSSLVSWRLPCRAWIVAELSPWPTMQFYATVARKTRLAARREAGTDGQFSRHPAGRGWPASVGSHRAEPISRHPAGRGWPASVSSHRAEPISRHPAGRGWPASVSAHRAEPISRHPAGRGWPASVSAAACRAGHRNRERADRHRSPPHRSRPPPCPRSNRTSSAVGRGSPPRPRASPRGPPARETP